MRLLTRSDFDGLVSGVLLMEMGIVDEYKFVHPKDVQDGIIKVTSHDVLANIPYVPGAGLWFDHHSSETERLDMEKITFEGACYPAKSAAQVIWDYYGGEDVFSRHLIPLLEAVNKSDSGDFTADEVLNPTGFILLSFIMDPRTGLGRFKNFGISNYQLMEDLVQYCRIMTADEIMEIPDIRERVDLYFEHQEAFLDLLKRCCTVDGNVIINNMMGEETIFVGNRFAVYALFPEQNIEVRVMWGKDRQNVVFSCGHSIINKTSRTDVGALMLTYKGGGHKAVGTCQVPVKTWEQDLKDIVEKMKRDG